MKSLIVMLLTAGFGWCDSPELVEMQAVPTEQAAYDAGRDFDRSGARFAGFTEQMRALNASLAVEEEALSGMTPDEARERVANLTANLEFDGNPVHVVAVPAAQEGQEEEGLWASIKRGFNSARTWMYKQWRRLPEKVRVFIGGFAIGATGAGFVAFIGGPHVATVLIVVMGLIGGTLALVHEYSGEQIDEALKQAAGGGDGKFVDAKVVETASGELDLVALAEGE